MVTVNMPYEIKTAGLEEYALQEVFDYTSKFVLDGAQHSYVAKALLDSACSLARNDIDWNLQGDFKGASTSPRFAFVNTFNEMVQQKVADLPSLIEFQHKDLTQALDVYQAFHRVNAATARQTETFDYDTVLKEIRILQHDLLAHQGIPPSTLGKAFIDAGIAHLALENHGMRAFFCAVAAEGNLEHFAPSQAQNLELANGTYAQVFSMQMH